MLASHVPTVLSKTKPEVPKDQTDEAFWKLTLFCGRVSDGIRAWQQIIVGTS